MSARLSWKELLKVYVILLIPLFLHVFESLLLMVEFID